MLRTRLRYLIILLITSLLYVFYVGYLSYFLFIVVLVLPCISLLLLILGMMRFQVQLKFDQEQYEKNEKVQIQIQSRTRLFPLAQIDAKLSIHNVFSGENFQEDVRFTSEYGYSEVVLPLKLRHCGKIECRIEQCKIRDALGIFRFSKKLSLQNAIYCMPEASVKQEFQMENSQDKAEQYSEVRAGNDLHETFDVHPYRPGDSLHRIHWKLSAKVDEWMVREGSMLLQENAKVIFSLYGDPTQGEAILAHVYGFSQQCLKQGHSFEIIRYEEERILLSALIENYGQLSEVIRSCLTYQPNSQAKMKTIHENWSSTSIFYVNHQGVYQNAKEGVS